MATSILTGVMTNLGRELLAKQFINEFNGFIDITGGAKRPQAFKFKYGEGGFIDTGSGRIPKSPEDGIALLDVEAAGDPSLFFFEKLFVSTDFTFIQPTPTESIAQVRCRLVELEANDPEPGPPAEPAR